MTYTVLIIGINIVASCNTNLLEPKDPIPTHPADIKLRIYGSKWVMVLEQSAIHTCWGIKFCFLIMYDRLT
jgi:hypothetical protein